MGRAYGKNENMLDRDMFVAERVCKMTIFMKHAW